MTSPEAARGEPMTRGHSVHRGPVTIAIAVAAAAAVPGPLPAQEPPAPVASRGVPPRHGLWIGLGFGGGQVEHWSDQEPASRRTTLASSVRGGIVVFPALRLGIEANGWGLESGNANDPAKGETLNETLATAQVYPWPSRGFYLKGGVGRGEYHTNHADDWGSSAFGATVLGAGYELRVARDVFVTLAADWARGPLGSADARVVTSTGRRFHGWDLIVGVQYH